VVTDRLDDCLTGDPAADDDDRFRGREFAAK
jgi:hypothetical protein